MRRGAPNRLGLWQAPEHQRPSGRHHPLIRKDELVKSLSLRHSRARPPVGTASCAPKAKAEKNIIQRLTRLPGFFPFLFNLRNPTNLPAVHDFGRRVWQTIIFPAFVSSSLACRSFLTAISCRAVAYGEGGLILSRLSLRPHVLLSPNASLPLLKTACSAAGVRQHGNTRRMKLERQVQLGFRLWRKR